MTYNYIPKRESAWQGLNPQGEINFKVSLSLNDNRYLEILLQSHFFSEVFQIEGKLLKTNSLSGHYKVVSSESSKWVVHVKNVGNSADLASANEIVDYLVSKGMTVPRYRKSFGGETEVKVDKFFVTVTEYFSARHSDYSIQDVSELGSSLKSLHWSLKKIPNQKAIKGRCSLFDKELIYVSKKVLDLEANFIKLQFKKHVYEAADRKINGHFQSKNLQVIHGDLSPGNILFLQNNKVAFCDFEDTCFSFRSVNFDIAMVVARFCLSHITGPDGSNPEERIAAFLKSYSEFSPDVLRDLQLKTELQIISDHFLIVMASLALNNTPVPDQDWLQAISWPMSLEEINIK